MLRAVAYVAVVGGAAIGAAAACNKSDSKPPPPNAPADCTKVAEIVSNFEVGQGAAPEVRAAAVARHRDTCKAANLTVTEANCIAGAKTTWAIIECAPAMFPERAHHNDCKAVATRMREAIVGDMPPSVGSAGTAMVDKMIPIIESSCRSDNWPDEYRSCVKAAPAGDMAAFKQCDGKLPQKLQFQLGERLKPIIQGTLDAPDPK